MQMRFKKFLSMALVCMLFWESPMVSQSAVPLGGMEASGISQDTPDSQESSFQKVPKEEAPGFPSAPQEEVPGLPSAPQEEVPGLPSAPQEEVVPGMDADAPGGHGAEEAQWVSLSQEACSLSMGDTLQLEAEAEYPSEITWSSSQEEIVSVSEEGRITAKGIGTARITARAAAATEEGVYIGEASCEVTVENSIILDCSSLEIYPGQGRRITAVLQAEEPIAWFSSHPEIASVDAHGEVKAKKAGHATITAITESGASDLCRVTVKSPSLKLKSKATAYIKSPFKLEATASPQGTVTWKSSNPKVAKVDANGRVTPLKTGTVTITAACNGLSKTCIVTVKSPSLKLKTAKAIVYEGGACHLDVTAKPSSQLKWKSSNPKVASVNKEGEVVGRKAGTATLTASLLGKKAACKVQVLPDKHKISRTSITVMKGQTATLQLLNLSETESVYFQLVDDSWGYAGLSYTGNVCEITGEQAGTATVQAVYSTYMDGQNVAGTARCTIKIVDSGISQQQISLAVHAKKTLKLKNVGKSGLPITNTAWESSNPKVADIDGNGIVTGKAVGTVRITAAVTYADGSSGKYLTTIKISNPKLKSSSTVMTVGKSKKLKLTGANSFSKVKWKISKSSLASIRQDGTVVTNYSTGKAVITLSVDGKTIKHKLTITNPKLKSSYKALAVGEAAQISVKGASSKKNITYKSKNNAVAAVSKSGRIQAKSNGNADIIVKADGVSLTFKVSVAPQRALSACKTGHQIMYSSSYSQARRMETGFYDCSSLVFRAYGRDAGLLGGISSYAPTAASMAYYLERTGKAISFQGLDASKLLPGDLIFYGDPYNQNGRYKNIYHVSMYYGNGYRLEKPLRDYYPDGNIVLIARPIR